jgi:tight adherence protein B
VTAPTPSAPGWTALVWALALCAAALATAARARRAGRARHRRVLLAAPGAAEASNPYGTAVARLLGRARGRVGGEAWLLAGGAVLALAGGSPAPLVLAVLAVPPARRALRGRARRIAREQRADEVIALCAALVGEVRAGRQPGEALVALPGASGSGLGGHRERVLAAARFGGDVPRALAGAAVEPGAEGLRGLAACWRVAVDRGAGLAAGLERVENALRAERERRGELRAGCAGARATAVLLAGLPAVGLLFGWALGAQPLRVLLHTGAGLLCLGAGAALETAGLWWASRIVRGAER